MHGVHKGLGGWGGVVIDYPVEKDPEVIEAAGDSSGN